MNDYLILAAGIACAALGGEFFVRGTVGIAAALRISPALIGVTIAAFATSAPELSVAVNSGLAGKSEIALGDALGSNIVNISVVLGIALLISGIQVSAGTVRRDVPVALLVPVLTAVFLLDHTIDRFEGLFMLSVFAVWLVATMRQALRERSASSETSKGNSGITMPVVVAVAGLLLLILAGRLIVVSVTGIAHKFALDAFIVGATLVAFGTSVPELASIIFSKIKGHDEIGLGTVLGSNIFNNLFIVPVAVMIHPVHVPFPEAASALLFGILSLLLALPRRGKGIIRRRQGGWLVLLYSFYVMTLLFFRY